MPAALGKGHTIGRLCVVSFTSSLFYGATCLVYAGPLKMDDGSAIVFIALLGLCIWLVWKLRAARRERQQARAEKDALHKTNVELATQNALLAAEHLKFQLQPHTLNNILANLKTISSKLSRGMDALSETLEYILYKGRTNLVSVKDELDFIETYLRLNDLFLPEVDAITVTKEEVDRTSRWYNEACIPHLISAYFIENAFKHGDKDHPEFLRIRVKLDRTLFQLHVSNRIRQKPDPRLGGLGLANMEKRLELLLAGRYEVRTSSTHEEYHAILTIQYPA